ncbi:MAG: HD domain-containing protein [Planctomycetota bacterium]|nr:HD domain-containing protein [Planctomycetota bacterium]
MAKLDSLFPDDIKPAPNGGGKAAKAPSKGAVQALAARPSAPAANANGGGPGSTGLPRTFISEFQPGQEIDGIFLVQDASMRAAKNGSKYIQASFGDRSGMVPVRQWDANDKDFEAYKQGSYIRARGRVETYQSRAQLIVFRVEPADPNLVNASDFLPVSTRDPKEMEAELDALLASFTDPDYKRLLGTIFSDAKVRAAYLKGPAASSIHHAWVHGLLEHVLSACKTAQSVCEQRPFLNRDLLMAGVLLHDIGKIEEIDAGPGFGYTDTGRLCGHISLGSLMVERFILKLGDFPPAKRDLIQHLILSHHGEREHGSPVTPCTLEAVALHHIECMDAKVQGIQSIIEREAASGNSSAWSDFSRVVDGRIYKGKKPE